MDFLEFNRMSAKEVHALDGIEICFSEANLEDKYLPSQFFGSGRKAFSDLATGQEVNDLLYRATWWYRRFWKGSKPTGTVRTILECVTGTLGEGLPIGHVLQSQTEPQGLNLFKNALHNCDGVLMTLLLAWAGKPGPWQDWHYVDDVIDFLVTAFMRDVKYCNDPKFEPFYTIIKEVRASIKDLIPKGAEIAPGDVRCLFFYVDLLPSLNEGLETRRQVQDLAILTQKRSIGLPPVSYREQAYAKYYSSVTAKQEPLSGEERALLRHHSQKIWTGVESQCDFTAVLKRCQRNEKVSLSGSSDTMHTREEGGKISSAHRLLDGLPVREFNLETGEPGEFITADDLREGRRTVGEALFYMAIARFSNADKAGIQSDPALFTVKPVAIPDQGKYRVATASHPLHSFLLQPLAQITKSALKHLESSRAGMSKQHHAWEFLKRISPDMVDFAKREDKPILKENFLFSSDWSMATDNFNKQSARIVIEEAGKALGVPSYYLKLCVWAITAPRVNRINPNEGVDPKVCPAVFVSTTGILQGDPCSKTILQLTHGIALSASHELFDLLGGKSSFPNPVREGHPERDVPSKFLPPSALFSQREKSYRKATVGVIRPASATPSGSVLVSYPLILKRAKGDDKKAVELLKEYFQQVFRTSGGGQAKAGLPNLKEELAFFVPLDKGG
jgi:hypothetical protein